MTKLKFLLSLNEKLSDLPQTEIEERLRFYSEMIEDRMEEGFSEEEAVMAVGSVEEISAQIKADILPASTAKEKGKPKRRRNTWEIILLVLGCPIWISLLVAVFAVILSLSAALWSVIVSLWAVFISVIACALGSILAGVGFACFGNSLTGAAMIGAGLVCGGISMLLFFGCNGATKGSLFLTKKIVTGIKNCLIKEAA